MENVKKIEENSKSKNFFKVIKGSIISIILTLLLLLIISLILTTQPSSVMGIKDLFLLGSV